MKTPDWYLRLLNVLKWAGNITAILAFIFGFGCVLTDREPLDLGLPILVIGTGLMFGWGEWIIGRSVRYIVWNE